MTPELARPAFLNLCSVKHWNYAECEQVPWKKLEAKKSFFLNQIRILHILFIAEDNAHIVFIRTCHLVTNRSRCLDFHLPNE
jgi:hypothetical protein